MGSENVTIPVGYSLWLWLHSQAGLPLRLSWMQSRCTVDQSGVSIVVSQSEVSIVSQLMRADLLTPE